MKKTLVTGGAGFIGSHLVETLLARGNVVIALDDESTGAVKNLEAAESHRDFSFVAGSVEDREVLRELLASVDEVYHLAAAVGVRLVAESPIESIQRNIGPTQVLLEELQRAAEKQSAVKLFFASSSEVYGKNPKSEWSEEDSLVFGPTTRMRWSYGAAKAIDEFLALAYSRQHGLPVVIGRFFNVIGPRQSGRYGMVLPRFVENALEGRPPVVHDDGSQIRCFAHVQDICDALLQLMEAPQAEGEVVNIGSDIPVTILELAERVVRLVDPSLGIEFESYRDAYSEDFEDVRRRVPDLTKLCRLIDYKLQYDLDDVIREVIEWKRR